LDDWDHDLEKLTKKQLDELNARQEQDTKTKEIIS